MVKNYVEVLVDTVIADLLKEGPDNFLNCCCELCLDNVRAISLNNLKPYYITSREGEVYGTFNKMVMQERVDILSQVLIARDMVNAHPRHS